MTPFALHEHLVNGGRIERTPKGFRLIIPPTDANAYVDAQLDDYGHELPRHFSNRTPQHIQLRARFSHQDIKGTAGFGFWNHPFSREGRVIDSPCNVWFFYSSPESHLRVARGLPGNGFKASMLYAGRTPKAIVTLGSALLNLLLRIPVVSSLTMSLARSVVNANEAPIVLDMTQWHEFDIRWVKDRVTFSIDGREVLHTTHSPQIALGFAVWIDNYRASAGEDIFEFAYVDVCEEQWLELEIIERDE